LKILVGWILAIAGLALCTLAVTLVAFTWQAGRREIRNAHDAAPPGGRYRKAGDIELFVQEAGPADGPAVLFIHGTGAWSEAWRGPMEMLAKQGIRAIAIDLPPFGYSERPANSRYGKEDQGRRIVAILDALQIPRAILVGHSFGGGPTVEAATLAPERVRALVLVDAALSVADANADKVQGSALLSMFLAVRPLRDSVVAAFLTNPLFTRRLLQGFIDDPARATDEWVALYQRPLAVEGTTAAVGAWLPALIGPSTGAASENSATYRALTMPVYLIWGERDRITPLAQGEELAHLVPGAELTVIKQVGHIPQIEDADAFNEVLGKVIVMATSASEKP
jgi:pimeloyl-ACP methyl ester carboxylesterase